MCVNLIFTTPTLVIIGSSRSLLKSLLEFTVLNSYFMCCNKFYKQTAGLGMGNPLMIPSHCLDLNQSSIIPKLLEY